MPSVGDERKKVQDWGFSGSNVFIAGTKSEGAARKKVGKVID